MPLQRACDAENQARNKLSNGPLRAQSNGEYPEYSVTLQADVICREYVSILLSARVVVNQGGTADFEFSPLTDSDICQGLFLFYRSETEVRMTST